MCSSDLMEMKDGKIVYNVANDPTNAGATTLEVLQKLPYVTVDNDNNIRVKGSASFKVKLNGRNTGIVSRNPKEALQAFPANTIVKIEVITTPSAKDAIVLYVSPSQVLIF